MKKTFFKLSFVLLLFLAILSLSSKSNANKIESISMDIYIDSTGTANITEIWKANLDSGTEGYKPYGDLGNCEIIDFTVSDDSGRQYTSLNTWTVSQTFDEKKYKCGINYTNNGLELCWGISNYGDRTYTLKYKITNFINQYEDCQGINFFLMPIQMDQHVGSVEIKISAPYNFSEAYGYGFKGTTQLKDGSILINTTKKFKSSNYVVIAAKFEPSYFPIGHNMKTTFNQDLSELQDYVNKLRRQQIIQLITIIISIGLSILFVTIISGLIYVYTAPELAFEGTNKLPTTKETEYWREIPCEKDLQRAYWIGQKYNLITDKSGLLGAILLIWIQKGYINITKTKSGLFSLKDNNYAIDFTNFSTCEDEQEMKLLKHLRAASGSNLILEHKEFEKYCKSHYEEIEKWFEKLIDAKTKNLEDKELISKKPLEKKFLFFHKTHTVRTASISLREEAIQLKGLKKFLLDYSLINKREAIEVQLWEEYLIFAELLGIADKVSEQFSKLYPDMNQLSNLNTDFTTLAISNMSYSGYHAAHSAYSSAHSGGSYGGGGSHGGSSGGGFR